MDENNNIVTLEVKINANTLSCGISKLENFAKLIEKLSREAEGQGIMKLFISADMSGRD